MFLSNFAKSFMKGNILLICLFLIVLTVFPRLYKLDNPVADWHSWRQADTAVVTRNFVQDGLSPLFPKFNTLNSLNELQIPNPNRYFFAEFPLYNIIHYYAYTLVGGFTLEEWGRLISIFFAALTSVSLFFLVKEYSSQRTAFFASVFFAILPYNVYYGRTILPDPMHVFFGVLTLYLVTLWVRKNTWYFPLMASVAFAICILAKPYGLVLLLPIAYLWIQGWKLHTPRKIWIYLFLFLSLFPLFLWRKHIDQHPEGMFATVWLFNAGNIRFTGAFFRWLIFERMNRLIFATGGFVLFWLGIVTTNSKKEGAFYYAWFASVLVFFVVIAKGNVTHDYYQLPLVPIGCIFMAQGVDFLLKNGHNLLHRGVNIATAVVLVLLMLAFGWYEVQGFFWINHPSIVTAGKWVDQHLPKNAIVIAPYDNDPAFLYQTKRVGFTYGGDQISKYIQQGAQYLVSVNYDADTNNWMAKCNTVEKNKEFVVVDLQNCKK